MAQSKVFMTINYAVMVEVQKTLTGYRFKLQYDSRALSGKQADTFLELFDKILGVMGGEATMGQILGMGEELRGIWKE